MNVEFTVKNWAAWPPSSQTANHISQKELLASIPGMLKRRLTPLARTVFSATIHCLPEGNSDIPLVFSSTHGELAKSLTMMEQLEQGEEISPTAFSLSVHNAIAGLFSMAFHDQNQTTVIAPGKEGLCAAFIETAGLLQEGHEKILLVFYDEPLPEFYPAEPFQLSYPRESALALLITQPDKNKGLRIKLSQSVQYGYEGEQPVQLPRLVQFLAQPQSELLIKTENHSWIFQKT